MEQSQNIQPAHGEEQNPKIDKLPGTNADQDETSAITEVIPAISADNNPIQRVQNTSMEVHHHGHVHHQKKWKEYIFQFFMLFLAVFCGFLAEYQLEHRIEKDKAKEFAESLITDLEKDTSAIKEHILFRKGIYKNADSLRELIKYSSIDKEPGQAFIYFTLTSQLGRLRTYKGTIDQLKASGSLRYFKNKQLTTGLINYYNQLATIDSRIEYIFNYSAQQLTPFTIAHADARYLDTVFRREKKIIPFRNMGEEETIRLYNIISRLSNTNTSLADSVLPNALKEADELIAMIKKEYHL